MTENLKNKTPPIDEGENAGYVDYNLILDNRTPTLELKTISGKIKAFNDMKTNSTVSGILLAFTSICLTAKHSVNENTEDPDRERAKERAKFLESCLDDMQTPFSDVVGEILDMIPMGFRAMVPQFKMRSGNDRNLNFNSKYNDGKIGWKNYTPIDPSTIDKWDTPEGKGYLGLKGLEQRLSLSGKPMYVHRNRLLLFRTIANNNTPIGKSILEGAFKDYIDLVEASRIQMTGLRRSLEGIPFARIHTKMSMDAKTNRSTASAISAAKRAVKELDSKEDNAFILPADRDDKGNLLVEVGLLGSADGGGNTRIQDAKVVIDAKEQTIARSMLAQFMTIQGKGGSYALSKTQSEVFINSLKMYMIQIAAIINGEAIPRLFSANGEGISEDDNYLPSITFSDFIRDDVTEFFTALQKSIEAGIFEVTPQVQKKAGQVLNIDISGQEDALIDRKKLKEELQNKGIGSEDDLIGSGDKDIPITKAEDITDSDLKDILEE